MNSPNGTQNHRHCISSPNFQFELEKCRCGLDHGTRRQCNQIRYLHANSCYPLSVLMRDD
eukprot:2768036-Pleurochrysis_carterae.AAC.6